MGFPHETEVFFTNILSQFKKYFKTTNEQNSQSGLNRLIHSDFNNLIFHHAHYNHDLFLQLK